jgi:hypothetical protein
MHKRIIEIARQFIHVLYYRTLSWRNMVQRAAT